MKFYLNTLPLLLLGLAFACGLVATFKWKNKVVLLATLICGVSFFSECVGHYLKHHKQHNITIYNIADYIKTNLWCCFFYFYYTNKTVKKIIITLILTYNILWFVFILFVLPMTVFQTQLYVFASIVVLTLSFGVLINEYVNVDVTPIIKKPIFWLVSGMIIYLAFTLPFLGISNWLGTHFPILAQQYFYIFIIGASLLLSIFNSIAFLCNFQKPKYGY